MSLTPLQERLQQPDVAALDEARAADVLNAPGSGDGQTWQDFPSQSLYLLLLEAGVWGLIELNSRRAATTALATAGSAPNNQDILISRMITLVRMVQDIPTIHASRSAVRTGLGAIFTGLETAGFISVAVRDAAIALAQRPASWAEANGYPNGVTARDIGLARGAR